MWSSLCSMWMLTKGLPQQKRVLIIKVERMTHCMDTSQIHFSATPVIGLMSKMALVPEMEVSAECHYGTLPQDDQSVTWWQVNYFGLLSSWKDQCFVFTSINNYSGYGLAFPDHNDSVQTTVCGPMECLTHHHVILHIIVSDQGTP